MRSGALLVPLVVLAALCALLRPAGASAARHRRPPCNCGWPRGHADVSIPHNCQERRGPINETPLAALFDVPQARLPCTPRERERLAGHRQWQSRARRPFDFSPVERDRDRTDGLRHACPRAEPRGLRSAAVVAVVLVLAAACALQPAGAAALRSGAQGFTTSIGIGLVGLAVGVVAVEEAHGGEPGSGSGGDTAPRETQRGELTMAGLFVLLVPALAVLSRLCNSKRIKREGETESIYTADGDSAVGS